MQDKAKPVFRVVVLADYCKGCGLCIEFCPAHKFVKDDTPNVHGIQQVRVDPDVRCNGCSRCVAMCPDAAIEIFRLGPRKSKAARP